SSRHRAESTSYASLGLLPNHRRNRKSRAENASDLEPGRVRRTDPFENRAIRPMSSRYVSGAHQKFAHDLSPHEHKVAPKDFHPLLPGYGMLMIQPLGERAMRGPNLDDPAGVGDGCVHLQSIANDAWIGEQPRAVFVLERRNGVDIEICIGPAKSVPLSKHGRP